MSEEDETVGIIFPLYNEIIERALEENKDVFAKYSRRKLEQGDTLYLYSSGPSGLKNITAKAKIEETTKLKPNKVWERYRDRLFQNKKEFNDYTKDRKNKKMLVLELTDIKELKETVEAPGNMTVAGLYVDKNMKQKIEEKT
ncbi:MAG: Hypothetical protein, DUF365 family [Candidatus Methanohalarchaeum thermophilum]|uniref:Uncharacterized protein n=1 Tax=Methanohalarchaeum thermophilum TaxID=1903181 RepID=A0A1Q6DWR1_METT1|nr:MAG: Hypothetical protein, DUF365 family [Candidatus Methanohalarchaeum thermophilum]